MSTNITIEYDNHGALDGLELRIRLDRLQAKKFLALMAACGEKHKNVFGRRLISTALNLIDRRTARPRDLVDEMYSLQAG